MKICVTGVTGFIGTHFCRRLQREGHSVIGMDLWQPESDLPMERFVHGDIRDPAAVRSALEGCDAVLYSRRSAPRLWHRRSHLLRRQRARIARHIG